MTENVNDVSNEEKPLDRKDLKIMALRQRLSDADDQIADLRVELTVTTAQLEEALEKLKEHEGAEEPKKG